MNNPPAWNSSTLQLSPSFVLSLCSSLPLFFTSSSVYQKSTSSASSEASETCQSISECSSPTAVSTACVSVFGHLQTRMHGNTHCLLCIDGLKRPVDPAWCELRMLCTLTQTCLSIPQFGSCSSFGTFRPAFSHTGTITRPFSVILPASPTFKHSPGSNTPSPTSKVPSWKVCFHLQF